MTTMNFRATLLSRLADAYPNQARNLTEVPIHLRVDDRDGKDVYAAFCDIHLKVVNPEIGQYLLMLDNVPFDDEVATIAESLRGTWQSTRSGERLTLDFESGELDQIKRLANAIRKVVGRGKSYLDRNWRWIAPRTASSLERLQRVLP
jgi:hypothetical protein